MKEMTEKVTKPLIQQVAICQKQNNDLQEQNQALIKSLKMVHAVIRSPLLCDMYSKQDRKMMT